MASTPRRARLSHRVESTASLIPSSPIDAKATRSGSRTLVQRHAWSPYRPGSARPKPAAERCTPEASAPPPCHTARTNASAAAADSPLSCFAIAVADYPMRVYYLDANHHVNELAWEGDGWVKTGDLTA